MFLHAIVYIVLLIPGLDDSKRPALRAAALPQSWSRCSNSYKWMYSHDGATRTRSCWNRNNGGTTRIFRPCPILISCLPSRTTAACKNESSRSRCGGRRLRRRARSERREKGSRCVAHLPVNARRSLLPKSIVFSPSRVCSRI